MKLKRVWFCVYTCVSSLLFGGWYPLNTSARWDSLAEQAGQNVEKLCVLAENERALRWEINETIPKQRIMNEQMDEKNRREAKAIKKCGDENEAVTAFYTGSGGRKILERIVEAEAGDQDVKGRVLVANVVLNRVRSKQFPDSIKGVVFSKGQFSPVSNGSYYRVKVSETTKKAVEKALKGTDYSKGALYFMCRSASDPDNVTWFDRDLTHLFNHGCHEFFR